MGVGGSAFLPGSMRVTSSDLYALMSQLPLLVYHDIAPHVKIFLHLEGLRSDAKHGIIECADND